MAHTEEEWSEWERKALQDFANGVKAARKVARLSQEKLAEAAGVTRGTIVNIEASRLGKMPSITTVVRLAAALKVPPVQLLYPGTPDGPVEVLPGVTVKAGQALMWFSGDGFLPTEDLREWHYAESHAAPTRLTRELTEAKAKVQQAEVALSFAVERAEKGYTEGLDARRDLLSIALSNFDRVVERIKLLGLPYEDADG